MKKYLLMLTAATLYGAFAASAQSDNYYSAYSNEYGQTLSPTQYNATYSNSYGNTNTGTSGSGTATSGAYGNYAAYGYGALNSTTSTADLFGGYNTDYTNNHTTAADILINYSGSYAIPYTSSYVLPGFSTAPASVAPASSYSGPFSADRYSLPVATPALGAASSPDKK